MKNGKNGYRCRNDGRGCSRKFTVTEKLALHAIEAVVPEAIRQCADIVTVIEAASAQSDVASIETSLDELEDRQRDLVSNWTNQKAAVPDWALAEKRALTDENSRLQAQLEDAQLAVRLAHGIIARALPLSIDPVATLRQLGSAHQEFFVRALFGLIELEGTGHGNGRNVRVVRWELNR